MSDISCWRVLVIWILSTDIAMCRFLCDLNLKATPLIDFMRLMASLHSSVSLYAARLRRFALRALVHCPMTRAYNFQMLNLS